MLNLGGSLWDVYKARVTPEEFASTVGPFVIQQYRRGLLERWSNYLKDLREDGNVRSRWDTYGANLHREWLGGRDIRVSRLLFDTRHVTFIDPSQVRRVMAFLEKDPMGKSRNVLLQVFHTFRKLLCWR